MLIVTTRRECDYCQMVENHPKYVDNGTKEPRDICDDICLIDHIKYLCDNELIIDASKYIKENFVINNKTYTESASIFDAVIQYVQGVMDASLVPPCNIGDAIYHIDTNYSIWEFVVINIENGKATVRSNDELGCEASFNIYFMPKPRLFYTRGEAEEKQKELKENSEVDTHE